MNEHLLYKAYRNKYIVCCFHQALYKSNKADKAYDLDIEIDEDTGTSIWQYANNVSIINKMSICNRARITIQAAALPSDIT